MLFMDIYDLTKDAAKWLKEHDIMYVGAMQKQSFKKYLFRYWTYVGEVGDF